MLIEQITGVARTQDDLENYIICDDKDLPVFNDEVLNDDNNINQFQHDKADYCHQWPLAPQHHLFQLSERREICQQLRPTPPPVQRFFTMYLLRP
jgi:hypothetical protein